MKKDGGPAFPVETKYPTGSFKGMSLRDYFAAHAMISFMQPGQGVIGVNMYEYRVAEQAYAIADAMIAERDK